MIMRLRLTRAGSLVGGLIIWVCGGEEAAGPGQQQQPPPPTVASVVVTPSTATLVSLGETVQLTASAQDASGTAIPGQTFTWSSSDGSVATVSPSGLVTAVAAGSATITAATAGISGAAAIRIEPRAVADPADLEALIASSFQVWWSGTQGRAQEGSPAMGLSAAADEFSLSWSNWAIRDLSSEPRVAYNNSSTYRYAEFTETPWFQMYAALSAVNDGIQAIDAGVEIGGPGGPDNPRAMAFAKFVQGLSHGWLALMFDQAFILDETVNVGTDVLMLKPYTEVWAAAQGYFQEAITIASAASFTLPSSWIRGSPLTSAELAQLAHSQLARWIPQVARTPAERDAVDWSAVIAHVDQGIQQDFTIGGDGYLGSWFHAMQWWGFTSDDNTWARADYKTIGWTDQGGGFAKWLADPVAQRTEFELDVPDRRITDGTPTGAGLDFIHGGPSAFLPSRGTYHFSFYQGSRYEAYPLGGGFGPITYMTATEMQLTKAEGMLRMSGPSQAVADIINATRVTRGQLPSALASESQSDLMDKLIYEKRIENYGVCSGCAFFDRRGLGPLAPTGPTFHHGHVEGTPLHFPVPGKELELLGLPNYTFGGIGNELAPPATLTSSTGVPARHLYAFRVEPRMSVTDKLRYLRESMLGERRLVQYRQ